MTVIQWFEWPSRCFVAYHIVHFINMYTFYAYIPAAKSLPHDVLIAVRRREAQLMINKSSTSANMSTNPCSITIVRIKNGFGNILHGRIHGITVKSVPFHTYI